MSRAFPASLQAEVWRRWKAGESLAQITRALSAQGSEFAQVLHRHGGIAPRARCRSRRALSLAEREEISRGMTVGQSFRAIARGIGRSPSTVSREIRRNLPREGSYRAHSADQRAWDQALRPKRCRLAQYPQLAHLVAQKLQLNWAPQQISGWLAREYGADDSRRVSHETIYRSLFIQGRGVLKKQLLQHLRSRRRLRHKRGYTTQGTGRGQIKDAISIRERPAQVEDRAIPGHWEGDLLSGSRHTQIATLVERHSRFVMLVKLQGRDTHSVITALTRKVGKLPKQLCRSITWDRGKEMAQHRSFSLATDIQVYFCDPHSPWQRGSNENTNGLLRQYFPKGTDLSVYSQVHLDKVALQLNQRPRKTLGFDTPANVLHAHVASTG